MLILHIWGKLGRFPRFPDFLDTWSGLAGHLVGISVVPWKLSCWCAPTDMGPFMFRKHMVCISLFCIALRFLNYISLDHSLESWKECSPSFHCTRPLLGLRLWRRQFFLSVMCESLLTLRTLYCLHKGLMLFIGHKTKRGTKNNDNNTVSADK